MAARSPSDRAAVAVAVAAAIAAFLAQWAWVGLDGPPSQAMAIEAAFTGLWMHVLVRPRDALIARWYSEYEDSPDRES